MNNAPNPTGNTPAELAAEYAQCLRYVRKMMTWLASQLGRHEKLTGQAHSAKVLATRLDDMRDIYFQLEYLLSRVEGMTDHAERTNRGEGGQGDE